MSLGLRRLSKSTETKALVQMSTQKHKNGALKEKCHLAGDLWMSKVDRARFLLCPVDQDVISCAYGESEGRLKLRSATFESAQN